MRSFLPTTVNRVAAALPVPHVPFIERKPELFRRAFVTAYQVANRERFSDLAVHRQIHGYKFIAVVPGFLGGVCEITMKGKSIDILVAQLQHFAVPLEICGHSGPAGSASCLLYTSPS